MSMNEHELMKTMEGLINSPNQKLIGDIGSGYVYATGEGVELMYAAAEISKAKRKAMEAENRLSALKYAVNDAFGVASLYRQQMMFKIKKVIFNNPATIVFWADGTKTVVKAENEHFDPEKGLAMAIAKKAFGNKGSYFNKIKEWTENYNDGEGKPESEEE